MNAFFVNVFLLNVYGPTNCIEFVNDYGLAQK